MHGFFCFLLIYVFISHGCDWWWFRFSTSGFVVGTVPPAEITRPFWLRPSGALPGCACQCHLWATAGLSQHRVIIHHCHKHLGTNPSLSLKASLGLPLPLASRKGEFLGSPCSLPCALQKVLRSQLYTVISPPSCKHDLLLFLIIDSECRVVP